MAEQSLDYYLKLPYPVRVYPEPDGSGYTAEIPDLPGCITCAGDMIELWEMIEDAKQGWLELAIADGDPIPLPSLPPADKELSGRLTLRLPRSLHRKLAEQADREGVSLNQLINVTLAESIGLKRAA